MAAIKAMKPYIKHAQELDKFEPVLAYFCRFYAVQVGVAINQKTPDPEAKQQLIGLLTRLESDKKNLATQLDNLDKQGPQGRLEFVESFALRVFDKADQDDRAGIATNATALSFYSAIHFFEILKQFYDNGELPPEILERQKYAKWKAVYIKQCLKQGITPKPGPADSGEEENPENGEGQHEGLNGTGGEVTDESRGMMDDAGNVQHQLPLELPSPPTVLQPPPQSQPQFFSAFPQPPQSSPHSSPATSAAQPHNPFPQYPATTPIPQFTQPPQPQPQQQQPQPPSYSQQPPVQFQPQSQPQVHIPPQQPPAPNMQQFLQIQQKFAPPPQVFMHNEVTDEDLLLALKHSRFVVSALQFEDIPTAITNLRTALAILTKNPNPQV